MSERRRGPYISRREAYAELGRSIRHNPIPVYVASFTYLMPEVPGDGIIKLAVAGLCMRSMRRNFERYSRRSSQ